MPQHLPDPISQPQFYAAVPAKRLLAWLVDTVAIMLLCAIILPFTAFTGLFFMPFLFLIVGFAYRLVTLASGSATWGMRFAGVELRHMDGARLTGGTAILHTLGYSLSLAIFPVQVVSVVMMLITPYGQGLSDSVLGVVALNRRASF